MREKGCASHGSFHHPLFPVYCAPEGVTVLSSSGGLLPLAGEQTHRVSLRCHCTYVHIENQLRLLAFGVDALDWSSATADGLSLLKPDLLILWRILFVPSWSLSDFFCGLTQLANSELPKLCGCMTNQRLSSSGSQLTFAANFFQQASLLKVPL